MLKEAADIMEEAGKSFREKAFEKQKPAAEIFFACASRFRKAAAHIANGYVGDAVEIIRKLCTEFEKRNPDWGKSCSELIAKLLWDIRKK